MPSPALNSAPDTQEEPALVGLLTEAGFDEITARRLLANHPGEVIRQQLLWLPQRNPSRNPVGMLRRAIEDNWPAPASLTASITTSLTGAKTQSEESLSKTFATYFYAGWAGNSEPSTAPPSANDLIAAEPYVQKLLALWPDAAQVAEWGRVFGVYVGKAEKDNPKVVRSLVYALRSHGDAFYVTWRERRKRAVQQSREQARTAHQAQYQEAFVAYLRTQEAEIRVAYPEAYARYEVFEEEQRSRYRTGIFANSRLAERVLETHNREEERLRRFQEFFHNAGVPQVADFWGWDRVYNADRFTTGEDV